MKKPFENFGGNFESSPTNNTVEATESVGEKDVKRGRLEGLQQRLSNLEAWSRSWTPADRSLADFLESQIAQLKSELGE